MIIKCQMSIWCDVEWWCVICLTWQVWRCSPVREPPWLLSRAGRHSALRGGGSCRAPPASRQHRPAVKYFSAIKCFSESWNIFRPGWPSVLAACQLLPCLLVNGRVSYLSYKSAQAPLSSQVLLHRDYCSTCSCNSTNINKTSWHQLFNILIYPSCVQ